ncbi:NAD synthetase [Serinicoccus hydrothermalis]|uniref:Glutamine-dependent NAD(+) synthetase n=1 Tax=Serinicoccus hydrothermalis TaxID=1758689 RepID=A0A1B1N938_9MICO|nr:NAD(+) synthase [Serinicoccus hydrothermalis]ANS77928.1 NAD synthetase [Serinicoccus hydrothermalis]
MEFYSAYDQGFARIASCTLPVEIADPGANARHTLEVVRECHEDGVAVAVLPELGLSGYAIDDLLLQDALLDGCVEALWELVEGTADLLPVVVVGAPLRHRNRLYNCAVVVHRGRILGVAPKSYLPNYREFYEKRHFAAGAGTDGQTIRLPRTSHADTDHVEVPFGPDLLFRAVDVPGLVLHAEVCEDLWVPVAPSSEAALAGATVVVNLSGSPITVGKSAERHALAAQASSRLLCAYAYAAAGEGESSTDLSWDGQTMVHELGRLLVESERFGQGAHRSVADVDLLRIRADRARNGSFDDNARALGDRVTRFRTVDLVLDPPHTDIGLRRTVDRFPFVPDDPDDLALDCYETFSIQVTALAQRLAAIGDPRVVIGVSGGLDSTHALIVAARAMDRAGRPRSDILAFTMPGFATSDHTKDNATELAASLGVTFEEIDIRPMARQMLEDLGHPFAGGEPVYDVTFENVQAGLRTDFLFRAANQRGGIVLGTGDLSELALGWCTYGVGDQMSHYTVNSGLAKTLIQHVIRWVVGEGMFDEATGRVLTSILDTEITPELVPAGEDGKVQSTQEKIGPYELQDFTLHHVIRFGMPPSRVAFLAWHAWRDVEHGPWPPGFPEEGRHAYDLPTIRRWLVLFVERFFAFSQFKRSALPNGPKVSSAGALSPRGDWRAPSDANARVWLAELERNVPLG